jgi:hypothetical protein
LKELLKIFRRECPIGGKTLLEDFEERENDKDEEQACDEDNSNK